MRIFITLQGAWEAWGRDNFVTALSKAKFPLNDGTGRHVEFNFANVANEAIDSFVDNHWNIQKLWVTSALSQPGTNLDHLADYVAGGITTYEIVNSFFGDLAGKIRR